MDTKVIKALVIDDSNTTVVLMTRLLEGLGVEVVSSDSAPLAAEIVHAHEVPFNIIFLDICMPDYSGNQLAKDLRDRGYKGAIIAFTATPSTQGQSHSLKSGIDKYLGKTTISKTLLAALLESYCK